jgi:hypothetical protein
MYPCLLWIFMVTTLEEHLGDLNFLMIASWVSFIRQRFWSANLQKYMSSLDLFKQELWIIASLATVFIFHAMKHKVLFKEGVPLGLLLQGSFCRLITFYWSPAFWRFVMWSSPRVNKVLIGPLVISRLLALFVKPSSAVLMLPRMNLSLTRVFTNVPVIHKTIGLAESLRSCDCMGQVRLLAKDINVEQYRIAFLRQRKRPLWSPVYQQEFQISSTTILRSTQLDNVNNSWTYIIEREDIRPRTLSGMIEP